MLAFIMENTKQKKQLIFLLTASWRYGRDLPNVIVNHMETTINQLLILLFELYIS